MFEQPGASELVSSKPARPRLPRMGELIADQIRRKIINGQLTQLPPEAELLEQFNVSRPSLREAFRILETEGLVRIRRGNQGGSDVTPPTPKTAAYQVALVLQASGTLLSDVSRARTVLEPVCAQLAAARDDHAEIGEMLHKLADAADGASERLDEYVDHLLRFHQALLQSSGNETITLLAGCLAEVFNRQQRRWARTPDGQRPREVLDYPRTLASQLTRAVAQHISDGDPQAAADATRQYLEAFEQAWRDQVGQDPPIDVLD